MKSKANSEGKSEAATVQNAVVLPPLCPPYSPFKGIPGSCGLIMRGQGSRRGTRNSLLEIDHLQNYTQQHRNLLMLNFVMALIEAPELRNDTNKMNIFV